MKFKRIIQRLLFEALKFLLILSVICIAVICIHRIGTFTEEECAQYVIKNSETGADAFYPHINGEIYFVSENKDKKNELFIFVESSFSSADILHLKTRYKLMLHKTSEEKIDYIIYDRSLNAPYASPDKLLIFHSNNTDMVSYCNYTVILDDGTERLESQSINRFSPFILQIPFVYNYGQTIFGVKNVSFYDISGEPVYEIADPLGSTAN